MEYFYLLILGFLPCVRGTTSSVWIDTNRVQHEVEEYFLSVILDTYLMEQEVRWETFDFSSQQIHTLLKGLSPALLRIGGTPADFAFFDESFPKLNKTGLVPEPVVIIKADIDNLMNLSQSTGVQLLFEFNLQLRYGDQWDPTNAMAFLDHVTSRGFKGNLAFELGNEPGFYDLLNSGQTRLSGSHIGKDYMILKRLLETYPSLANCSIVGPDIMYGAFIFKNFIDVAGGLVKAATFHHYYFSGTNATYKDYINPFHFDGFQVTTELFQTLLRSSGHPYTPLWVGEAADAMNSGTPDVSDRFVSGFLWLDKLGLAAQMGLGVVMRQDFYGHFYGLIDQKLDPNPDYWLSWLHKQLVGTKVLKTHLLSAPSSVRGYAHCTNTKSGYNAGAVTFFALNVNEYESAVMMFNGRFKNETKHLYLMQPFGPEGLLSKYTAVNGRLLKMVSSTTFPEVRPVVLHGSQGVEFPPLTFGFVVLPHVKLVLCT